MVNKLQYNYASKLNSADVAYMYFLKIPNILCTAQNDRLYSNKKRGKDVIYVYYSSY